MNYLNYIVWPIVAIFVCCLALLAIRCWRQRISKDTNADISEWIKRGEPININPNHIADHKEYDGSNMMHELFKGKVMSDGVHVEMYNDPHALRKLRTFSENLESKKGMEMIKQKEMENGGNNNASLDV